MNYISYGNVTGADESTLTVDATGKVKIKDVVGVTPGSYTSTNLTVNQKGQITAAANGAAQAWVILADVTTSGSTALKTVMSSIPTGYKVFHLIAFGQKATNSQIGLQFNTDTANNYQYQENYGSSTTLTGATSASSAFADLGEFSNNDWLMIQAYISNISSIQKHVVCTSGSIKPYAQVVWSNWTNTANEINQIDIKSVAGNFVDGFRIILLGCTG